MVCPVLVAAGVIYANFSADPGAPFLRSTSMEDPPHRCRLCHLPHITVPSLHSRVCQATHEPLAEAGPELEKEVVTRDPAAAPSRPLSVQAAPGEPERSPHSAP